MRFQPDQKEKSKKAILKAAGRKLRERGLNGVGIDALAAEANVTSGAFYSNFKGKEDLFKSVIQDCVGQEFDHSGTVAEKKERVRKYLKNYLQIGHCKDFGDGCAIIALSADVARTNSATKTAYRDGILKLLEWLAGEDREQAWVLLSMMVGAMTIARALPAGKERDELLEAALEKALQWVGK